MPAYEAMIILHPNLTEEEQKALMGDLENILKESQAQIRSSQLFARRQLAYEIKKCKEGLYYLMDFSVPEGSVVAKLKQVCNVNEKVLRILVVRKGKLKEVKSG